MEDTEAITQCEQAKVAGFAEAETMTQEMAASCEADSANCDCSVLEHKSAQTQCEQALAAGLAEAESIAREMRAKCTRDPMNCDCSSIVQASGRQQCEAEYQKHTEEAYAGIRKMLGECIADPQSCECETIQNPEILKFCQEQREIGTSCLETGKAEDCDRIDAERLLPRGMPKFLQPFFSSSIKKKVDAERSKRLGEVYKVMASCVEDVESCDCSQLEYDYAQNTCEKQKKISTDCINGDAEACDNLDDTAIFSSNLPSFVRPFMEKRISSLIKGKKDRLYAQSASVITDCIKDAHECDCTKLTYGQAICEERKAVAMKCEEGDIDACMDIEGNVLPANVPSFIRGPLEKIIQPLIAAKKKGVAMSMMADMGPKMATCFENPESCDCSFVPKTYQSFCEERRLLGVDCIDGDFEACETLENLPMVPEDVPSFVRGPLEGIVKKNMGGVMARIAEAKAQARSAS